MSDLFERNQQHNFYQYGLPESSVKQGITDNEEAALLRGWNEKVEQKADYRNKFTESSGTEFSSMEFNLLYKMRENGIYNDDNIYRYAFSKDLSEYLRDIGHTEYNTRFVFDNYDAIWQAISGDMGDRYALPKSRYEAVKDSIQIANNMMPLGKMGLDLQNLHGQLSTANEDDRQALQKKADELWEKITKLRNANEELGKRMPKDALSTILTSTIQSAPLTLKSTLAGVGTGLVGAAAGAVATGGAGAGLGFKYGYALGSFAASSSEMAGLLYVDMIAAGVEQQNAARLATLGGGINGLIESSLGTVAGAGKSLVKTIGVKALSKEAQEKIAQAASKNFVKKISTDLAATKAGQSVITKTIFETLKQTGGEGLEEGLQYLTEHAMFAIADAMQDTPVERELWWSPQFQAELKQSIIGGLAGGLGFGILGLPLNITGNIRETARQTEQLKNLAIAIENEDNFRAVAKDNSLTKNLTDDQINQIHKSQEGERQAIRAEEAARAQELRNKRLYGALDQSGDTYRGEEGLLYMEHSRHTESNGITTGEFAAGDPNKSEKNSYAIGNYELRGDTAVITEFRIGQKYEGLQNEILQNFANDIGKEIEYNGQRYAPNGEGHSLRFGWDTERSTASEEKPKANAYRFNFDRQPYSAADTQADTTAKQNFANQLRSLDTQLSGDAEINTVVDFYDTVGRKWFGMGFDSFMSRMTGGNKEGWIHQNLSDKDIAIWLATISGLSTDKETLQYLEKDITDAQRELAKQRINGSAVLGSQGVTKAIYAARNADISTFIHEGVHAFTKLAEAVDPALYREMMEAAGLSMDEYNRADTAGKEQMMRQAMETLAYGAEAYLKEGPKNINDSSLKNLYEKIKEFLKDLAYAIEKGKYLTQEVKALFDGLFGEANTKGNVTENNESVPKNEGIVPESSDEYEIYSDSLWRDIKNENLPLEKRAEAVMRNAELELLPEQDRKHGPTAELIKRARRITDPIFQKQTIAEIRELRERYAGTETEFKAPNGKESLLLNSLGKEKGREAWYAIRLESFKNWFGDWETLENSQIDHDVNSTSEAAEIIEKIINVELKNKYLNIKANISNNSLDKLIKDDRAIKQSVSPKLHALAAANIKKLFENAKIDVTHKDTKNQKDIKQIHRVGALMSYQGEIYPVKITLKEFNESKKGTRLYSVEALTVEKIKSAGQLVDSGRTDSQTPIADFNKKIVQLAESVKENVSKVVDENGEPKVVYHGTPNKFEIFDRNKGKLNDAGWLGEGHYFYGDQYESTGYARGTGNIMECFLNVKEPYYLSTEENRELAERNDRNYSIEFSEELKSEDHDGVYYNGDLRQEWMVFNPNQIKSATDNIGTFDPLQDNIYFQAAFHGSPYKFERFDSSHMGSGEGAQAYGWGHYFAGKKEVADWYRKQLKRDIPYYKGEPGDIIKNDRIKHLLNLVRYHNNDINTVKELLLGPLYEDKRDEYLAIINDIKIDEGQLYEVDIPDNEEMLDWDKPMTEQSEKVKQALQKGMIGFLKPEYTGRLFYEALGDISGKSRTEGIRIASEHLNSLGIKGIRYLDGSSRADGEGSHNYVIFDDNDINITQTYYSEAFRDAGLSAFMSDYPDIVKEAAQFKSGAEMAEHYAEYFAMPDEVYKKAKALGYFDAIARAAKEGNAENATNAISGVSANAAVEALAAYGVDIKSALEAANLVRKDNWQAAVDLLEKQGVPRIDAEVYADTAKLFSKSEMQWLEKTANDKRAEKKNDEIIKIGKTNPAILKFFDTLVDGGKEIHQDKKYNEYEELRTELAGEEKNAKAFVDMIYTDKGFDDFISRAYISQQDRQQGETEAETKQNEAIYDRARTVFNTNNANWDTAFKNIAAGKNVNEHTKKIIRGMIRNRPLQYMETWAMMTGDVTWLPEENDIQRIKRLDTEGLVDEEYLERHSPEELERIGRRLSSGRLKKKIDDGTLTLDDPDLKEYEKQLNVDMVRLKKLITERGEGFKDYRKYLDMAIQSARKEQILLEQEALDTSNEGLKASRERVKELAKAHQEVRDTINEMERFMREDLTHSQREAFMELRNQLREQERIHSELKAIGDIREIKKRNLRQILRKPDLKTVSLHEAKYIDWIQAHFDSYQAVARFIGQGAKDIRQLYNEFATNADYRETLKKKLPPGAYKRIEGIVYEDKTSGKVRAYGTISAHDRRVLYRHLLNHKAIFEELGIDITEEPRKFNDKEWEAIRLEMQDRIPADLMYKLEGLLEADPAAEEDKNTGRRFKVENFTIEDIQTLAGVVSNLRKEGREREGARKEARSELWQEGRDKVLKTLLDHMPKNAIGHRMGGIASTKLEEEERSGWRGVWYSLHNARRFFRMLEGGKDDFLFNFITQREYAAFNQENGNVFRRREEVEKKFKDAGINIKDLGRYKFIIFNGETKQETALDEMLTFYYAQHNERALHAVIFGNFASQEEREKLKALAEARDIIGQMHLEADIAARYHEEMKKLDDFFAQEGNEKYKLVMNIIGEDFDDNYERLREFVAREYNEELGSEPYYMPLMRLGEVPKENNDIEQALADHGLKHCINKGFTKGRVDIPSFGQQKIQAGFYSMWDRMVVKQEHLMAYDPLHREMLEVFKGRDSQMLRETLERGHSQAAVKYIDKFISELAAPPIQDNYAALNKVSRILQGHYPAAVLGWRIASIVKQSIESPPPFFQYVSPWQYASAGVSCLNQETRDLIRKKSIYMKARYFDPAAAVIKEMERMYLTGKIKKAEAVLAKIESIGMEGQQWIDSVWVMPGWLAAYNKKFAELNNKESSMTAAEVEAEAVKYADLVVRDCQPSSVLMDQAQLLKGDKHPLARMFMQFQTPIASIFQQLFIDTPVNFKNGRILQGLWTWGIYALLAIVIGAMHEDEDDEEFDLKKRGINALVMPVSMIPIFGGDLSYAAESLMRNGKITTPRRSNYPVLDQGIRAINNISDDKWVKASFNAVKGFMYYSGMPVAAVEDIEKAIETGRPQRVIGIR